MDLLHPQVFLVIMDRANYKFCSLGNKFCFKTVFITFLYQFYMNTHLSVCQILCEVVETGRQMKCGPSPHTLHLLTWLGDISFPSLSSEACTLHNSTHQSAHSCQL